MQANAVPTPADLCLRPEWLIPMTAPGAWLTDHAVIVTGGRIVDVLPTETVAARYQPAREVALPNQVLMPGFVNAHTHAAMTLFRGFADDLPLQTWLEDHLWPAEARMVDREFVRHGSELAIAEMLRGGTTCFNDMYFFPEATAEAASRLRIRALIGLIIIGFPSNWAQTTDAYFERGQALHDSLRDMPLVRAAFAPHAPYSVDDGVLARVETLAAELDIPVHMHVHETRHEVTSAEREQGERPLARLTRHGLVNERLIAVHMTELSQREIGNIARYGVSVAHCPQSNLKLASGLCPVKALLDAGVNVALGTDGAASNNDLDMLEETRTAALLAKFSAQDPSAVSAGQALMMATINGARALGMGEEIGSIEIGKSADLITLDLDHPATQPVHDPVSQVVYAAGRDQVRNVWVGGEQRVADGALLDIDTDALTARARVWRDRLRALRHSG